MDAVVVVVGDQGVGKTTLVHMLCYGVPPAQTSWTVGCAVEVMSYTARSGRSHFIEFWDVGGALKYEKSRSVFYGTVNGIVLVHDLTNRKSYKNLWRWLNEVLQGERGRRDASRVAAAAADSTTINIMPVDDPTLQQRIGDDRPSFPILLVGTKPDELSAAKLATIFPEKYNLVQELGCESILVNATSAESVAAAQPALERFYEQLFDRNHATRRNFSPAPFNPAPFSFPFSPATPAAAAGSGTPAETPASGAGTAAAADHVETSPVRRPSFNALARGASLSTLTMSPPANAQPASSAAQHTDNLRRTLFGGTRLRVGGAAQ